MLQLYASVAVGSGGCVAGIFFAFPSVAVPILQRDVEDGGWEITLEQGSWFGNVN